MTPNELIVQALAAGAATQDAPAVRKAYGALRTHWAEHYPDLDLAPLEKRPDSVAKRNSLLEDLGETNAGSDATLLTLAAQLATVVAQQQTAADPVVAVDLDTVQAELIRLSQIKSSGVGARLKRTKAKKLEFTDIQAGEDEAALRAEFHDSPVGALAVNVKVGERDVKALAARYLNWLSASLNKVQLDGIDPQMASMEGARRLQLSAVYTALLTETREMELHKRSRLQIESREELQQLSAAACLNQAPKLVLLGDPGSGKSTFVDFVALCLAGELRKDKQINVKLLTAPLPPDKEAQSEEKKAKPKRQLWQHGGMLPVRVILRDFVAAPEFPARGVTGTATHLEQFIQASLQKAGLGECCGWLEAYLKDQGGLLLLDGLDEVPEADRRRIQLKQVVEAFVDAHSQCHFLVTGRPYAYQDPAWQLAGFGVAELAPFSRGQIRHFIERWYAQRAALLDDDPAKATVSAEQLKQAIFGNARLYELAERPLLLTLTAGIHAFRQGQLPEGRAELYDEAVSLLLLRWEDRIVNAPNPTTGDPVGATVVQESLSAQLGVERSHLRTLLEELAYNAHASQPTLTGVADIPEAALLVALQKLLRRQQRTDIPNDRLIHYLKNRTGLLIERAPGVYASPHRTFQEFLAACHLEQLDFPYQITTLARGEPNRWREVVLLTAARARNPFAIWSLVEKLAEAAQKDEPADAPAWGVLLGGQAVEESIPAEARRREPQKLQTLRQQLVQMLEANPAVQPALPARERALAGRVLGKLGDPRPYVMTVAHMQFCHVPAGDFYRTADNERADLPYAYWIGRLPVSNAQFGEFMAAGGYAEERYWPEAKEAGYWTAAGFQGRYDDSPRTAPVQFPEPFPLPNHPVVGVSWYEAVAFCRWLSERTEKQDWQVRLPKEVEWEKAARGGVELPAAVKQVVFGGHAWAVANSGEMAHNPWPQRRYPWGEALANEEANVAELQINATSALGCFAAGASPYGVEELSGTVWEWSHDPHELWGMVLRGGSYVDNADRVISSAGYGGIPLNRYDDDGYRCVVVPISRV